MSKRLRQRSTGICESKWWHGRKVSHVEVESLLRKAEGEGLETMRVWFFAHDGFTNKAEGLMKEKGVVLVSKGRY